MIKKLTLLLVLFLLIFMVGCKVDFESFEERYNLDKVITGQQVERNEVLQNLNSYITNFEKVEKCSLTYKSEQIGYTKVYKCDVDLKFDFSSNDYKKIIFYMELEAGDEYRLIFINQGYVYVSFKILEKSEKYKLSIADYLEKVTLDEFKDDFLESCLDLFHMPNYFEERMYKNLYLIIEEYSVNKEGVTLNLVNDSSSNLVIDYLEDEYEIFERMVLDEEYKIVYMESKKQLLTKKLFLDYSTPRFNFPSDKDYPDREKFY